MSASDDETGTSSSSWWSSWHDAHWRTCRDRGSLIASPQQVLDYTNANTSSKSNDAIFWSLPESDSVVEWTFSSNSNPSNQRQKFVEEVTTRFGSLASSMSTPTKEENKACTPQSPSSRLFQSVTKTVTATLTPLLSALTPGKKIPLTLQHQPNEEDDALRDWNLPMNVADTSNHEATSAGLVSWNQPVLNPTLTRMCLEILQKELESPSISSSASFPTVISRKKSTNIVAHASTCRTPSSWKEWLNQINLDKHDRDDFCPPKDLLSRLSNAETDFLLECMAMTGHIAIVPPDPISGIPQKELVVLGGLQCPATENAVKYQKVLASWWELTTAQRSLEARREEWIAQSQEWSKRALRERKAKLVGKGLTSFKIHKLYLQRFEQSEGTLLNLEQARHTLEESWHQREVLQALEMSTHTLQALRQDTQQIGELLDSYKEEVEHVNSVQQSLSTAVFGASHSMDKDEEDELLGELERLTIEDRRTEPSHDVPTEDKQGVLEAVDGEKAENTMVCVKSYPGDRPKQSDRDLLPA